MAVRLRLKRFGRRHLAVFRLSAMDGRAPRDGRVLEELGHYAPCHKDPGMQLQLNEERIKHWLRLGAVPSDTVRDMLKKNGITKS